MSNKRTKILEHILNISKNSHSKEFGADLARIQGICEVVLMAESKQKEPQVVGRVIKQLPPNGNKIVALNSAGMALEDDTKLIVYDEEEFSEIFDEVPAVKDVVAERHRQKEIEGFTEKHDDTHPLGQLSDAAICYANEENDGQYEIPRGWPWEAKWWKPKTRRRDLVRAAALIIAEIEQLDRLDWEG